MATLMGKLRPLPPTEQGKQYSGYFVLQHRTARLLGSARVHAFCERVAYKVYGPISTSTYLLLIREGASRSRQPKHPSVQGSNRAWQPSGKRRSTTPTLSLSHSLTLPDTHAAHSPTHSRPTCRRYTHSHTGPGQCCPLT